MCTLVCRCPPRPEKKVGCCGVGVIGGCEPLDMGTGSHVMGISGPLEKAFLFLTLSHSPASKTMTFLVVLNLKALGSTLVLVKKSENIKKETTRIIIIQTQKS